MVTFWRGLVQSNPFFFAYWQPLSRLLWVPTTVAQLTAVVLHSSRFGPTPPSAHVNPVTEDPLALRRLNPSVTAPRAEASAAACACFCTKKDQPRSTASPIIPAIANNDSVTSTRAC